MSESSTSSEIYPLPSAGDPFVAITTETTADIDDDGFLEVSASLRVADGQHIAGIYFDAYGDVGSKEFADKVADFRADLGATAKAFTEFLQNAEAVLLEAEAQVVSAVVKEAVLALV